MPDWKKYVRNHLDLPPLQPGRESQIVEEIAQQLDDAYRDELAGGVTEVEAEERARQHISDWAQFSEEIAASKRGRMPAIDRWHANALSRSPDSYLGSFVDGLRRDVLFSLRTLSHRPAFATFAIATIALGVAATVTSFTVLYAALWAPTPYPRGQELVVVSESNAKEGVVTGAVSAANFYDWKTQSQCFSALAAYTNWAFNLTGTDQPERINGAIVSPDFFNALQILPLQGRTFRPDEDEVGKSDVAVVSDRLWQRLFPSAQIGDQTVTLNGSKMTVIGIMPAAFAYPSKQAELWVPLSLAPADRQNRTGKWLSVFGRLKPGVTVQNAQQVMDVTTERLQRAYPASNTGWDSRIVTLRETQFGSVRKPLLLLQAAVTLLFLAACFNIAGLMLAHAKAREGEFETRLILGATRLRIVCQLLMESLILAGTGGLAGILLSYWVVALMRTELLRIVPVLDQIAVNESALRLAVLLVAVSVVICGQVPALRSSCASLPNSIHRGPVRTLRIRQALVISQVAFAVMLFVGTMAIVRSFTRLVAVDPGFNPQNAVALDLTFSKAKYATRQRQNAFLRDLLEEVRNLPGVVNAGAVSDLPLRQNSMTFRVVRPEDRELPKDKLPQAGVRWVTADYFSTMQISLVRGRFLDAQDTPTAPPAAVINRSMARRLWSASDPLGKDIRLEEDPRWFSIVGVVDDVKQIALGSNEVPALYLPYEQKSAEWLNWATVVVRSSTPPEQLVRTIRSKIHALDPDQPISKTATLEQYIDDQVMVPRFASAVSSCFSALALLLALVGISGIVAFAVHQRTHEIGVRLALGAERPHILHLVMREAARSAMIGLGIGLLAGVGVVRLMQTILYGVRASEPAILAQVGITIVLLTLIACYIPAKRATIIDPIRALRFE